MINHANYYNEIHLTPFMEDISIKPLLNGDIIEVNKKQFRVERFIWQTQGIRKIHCQRHILLSKDDYISLPEPIHCYVFVDITMTGAKSKSFAKNPSYVQGAIEYKKITIIKNWFPQ